MTDPITNAYRGYTAKKQPLVMEQSQLFSAKVLIVCLVGALIICLFSSCGVTPARAERINFEAIAWIESNNTAHAYNSKTQATGVFQITPVCLEEWNNFHFNNQYGMDALFDRFINIKIATWYLEIRIPQMLKHYKIPITIDNILWAYNAGIGNVVKNRKPQETVNYIKKYKKEMEDK